MPLNFLLSRFCRRNLILLVGKEYIFKHMNKNTKSCIECYEDFVES